MSRPRVKLNTAGLSPEQTALANRLGVMLPKLSAEMVARLNAVLDE